MEKRCPACDSSQSLRRILYGLPDGPPEDSEVVLGGCCFEESDPKDACIDCGWRGTLVKIQQKNNRN